MFKGEIHLKDQKNLYSSQYRTGIKPAVWQGDAFQNSYARHIQVTHAKSGLLLTQIDLVDPQVNVSTELGSNQLT